MEFFNVKQVLLVTVGVIGSGKSTLATAFEASDAHLVRCNQDDLGDRRAVENRVRQSLGQGKSVCVDRSNFDERQRQTWINIARNYPGTAIWALFLDVERSVCLERLRKRTNHPTIKDFETAQKVLNEFSSQLTRPCPCEGFDIVLQLTDDGDNTEVEGTESPSAAQSIEDLVTKRAQTVLETFSRVATGDLQDRQDYPTGIKQLTCRGHPKGKANSGGSDSRGRGRGSQRGPQRGPQRGRGSFWGRGGSSSSSSWRTRDPGGGSMD
ncbi:hypothetical protein M407DRAFT_180223 [Tulasnella calospora MUT 4182]|uniref:Uncharacterized protein n=1 Tax=Tulasnella calospora MUT 4182 TaxID=1051891 RepID=A0A0C3L402_9AGAM|nr:hypothetical protein M407DRAFT_180223 [Tulasnella calospora MUT 4182]